MHSNTHEYEASVLVKNKPVTEVVHNSQTYIEGRQGTTYELVFRNNTGRRVKVIPSVDGLNILDGKICGINSPGYIVDANDKIIIPGWKVDRTTAAKFKFNRQGSDKTYTETIGESTENQGTIGFMVFQEIRHNVWRNTDNPIQWEDNDPNWLKGRTEIGGYVKSYNTDAKDVLRGFSSQNIKSTQCSASASTDPDPSLGTGWGKATNFKTKKVEFQCEDSTIPTAVLVFMYDTLKNLKRKGVPVHQFKRHYQEKPAGPNPFPASPHVLGTGCTPPHGWKK